MRQLSLKLVLIGALCAVLGAGFRSHAFSSRIGSKLPLRMATEENKNALTKVGEFFKSSTSKVLPALLCAAAVLSFTPDAEAVPSGGRSGGSSFSRGSSSYSSRPSRPSTRINSYNNYGSTTVMPMPMMNPFYSPFSFGFGGFYSPFALFNPNVIILGMVAYAAFQVLKNRTGGANFSNDGEAGSLGDGATVVTLQVALYIIM